MAQLRITKRKVQLLLTGPKDILPCPVQETINVDKTFLDLLDKVIAQTADLPLGLKITRTHAGSSEKSVILSCRIRDFLGTHYKREMPIYRVRLLQPKLVRKSSLKTKIGQRASPRFAFHPPSISSTLLAIPDQDPGNLTAPDEGLTGEVAPNENPENVILPDQGSGEGPSNAVAPSEGLDKTADTTNEGPEDLVAPESSQAGSMVGSAPNEDGQQTAAKVPGKISCDYVVLPEAVVALDRASVSDVLELQKDVSEVGIQTTTPQDSSSVVSIEDADEGNNQVSIGVDAQGCNTAACSTFAQLQQLMDECTDATAMITEISQEIMGPPDILVPPTSLRSTPASSVVSVPLKSEWADWESESVLGDMRKEGVRIVDLKTQSHRRLAGVSNTFLLLAMEEKRKLKDKWQCLYGRAPVCARLLEELLKE